MTAAHAHRVDEPLVVEGPAERRRDFVEHGEVDPRRHKDARVEPEPLGRRRRHVVGQAGEDEAVARRLGRSDFPSLDRRADGHRGDDFEEVWGVLSHRDRVVQEQDALIVLQSVAHYYEFEPLGAGVKGQRRPRHARVAAAAAVGVGDGGRARATCLLRQLEHVRAADSRGVGDDAPHQRRAPRPPAERRGGDDVHRRRAETRVREVEPPAARRSGVRRSVRRSGVARRGAVRHSGGQRQALGPRAGEDDVCGGAIARAELVPAASAEVAVKGVRLGIREPEAAVLEAPHLFRLADNKVVVR
mmetsp:Transcript_2157/g.7882  ORF Transcript_2157/g.7882 Transcript_2157/m.7882 type:complete len:302 (+) Transcript_2157:223-1128(+)